MKVSFLFQKLIRFLMEYSSLDRGLLAGPNLGGNILLWLSSRQA